MIFSAIALGLSMGCLCLGHCLPILAPLMLSREGATVKDSSLYLGLFLLGKFISYLLFGLIVGVLGQYAIRPIFLQNTIIPVLFLILGIFMILYGLTQNFPHWKLCFATKRHFQNNWSFFVVGFLAGINICPPFLLAASYAFNLKSIAGSVGFFFFFFLATNVFILPLIFSGLASRFNYVRIVARMTAVIAGGWFVYQAGKSLTFLIR